MGYIIKRLKSKNRSWKVQYQIYKGGRRARDLKEDEWFALGFHCKMDNKEALERCRQLNSQVKLKKLQERRNIIKERLSEEDLMVNAHLPVTLRQEFEKLFIDKSSKKISHWRTAKKLMMEVKLDISDWAFYKTQWFNVFREKEYSLDYVQKLILVLNRWGKFVAYKQRVFFEPIPSPLGIDKQRIVDVYESTLKTKSSDPLTPEQLESKRSKFTDEHYNWLYLSIWLGLRPQEIDSLHKRTSWRIEDGVIWVYQSKLTGIPSKDRWKPIPIAYKEGKKCIDIINTGVFKRPLNKTLIKYFGGHTTCYCGRKGYVDLMLSRGVSLEAISQRLGHRSLDRTWMFYKNKKKVIIN